MTITEGRVEGEATATVARVGDAAFMDRGPESLPPADLNDADPPANAREENFGYLLRSGLVVLAAITLGFVMEMTFVSALQHRVAQQQKYGQLRKVLAEGTAPVSQTDPRGRLLVPGTPVALISIPSIHVREVVSEGTTSGILMSGPGHRRDTPLPGQAGVSIIMGRQAAFGGPFHDLAELHPGTRVIVTTGQGTSIFVVAGLRRGGSPAPSPLAPGKGRLTLITAHGTSFAPSGALRVDADQTTPTLATPPMVLGPGGLAHSEQAMAVDTGTLWALVLWLEALVAVAVGAVWSWIRWGRHQTWIVFLPLAGLIGLFVAQQFARLLPNLL